MIKVNPSSQGIYTLNPKISIKNSKFGVVINAGQRTYVLNEIGWLIINMITNGKDKNQVIETICNEYGVLLHRANEDFDLFIQKMITNKIIEKHLPLSNNHEYIYGSFIGNHYSKTEYMTDYQNVLVVKPETIINNEILDKHDFMIINGGNIMSETAIKARQHNIACMVLTYCGKKELMKSLNSIRLDYRNNIAQFDGVAISIKFVPDEIYLNIENIHPYNIRNVNNISRVDILTFLEAPLDYVLIKLTEENVIIYPYDTDILDKLIINKISQFFGKEVFVGSPNIYENYTSVSYGIYTDDNFKQIFKKITSSNLTINKIINLLNYCVQASIKRLDDAEEIIKYIGTPDNENLKNILSGFRAINDSAIYFTFANEVLPSYGLSFLLSRFKELRLDRFMDFIDFISAIDLRDYNLIYQKTERNMEGVLELINIYTNLVNCKEITNVSNNYLNRSKLWSKVARAFRIKTGRRPSEFLGQHGSGYKLESYLLSSLGDSSNLWEKLNQISKTVNLGSVEIL